MDSDNRPGERAIREAADEIRRETTAAAAEVRIERKELKTGREIWTVCSDD